MNQDQLTGRLQQARGVAKELFGKLAANPILEAKGRLQQTAGRALAECGDLKNDLVKMA